MILSREHAAQALPLVRATWPDIDPVSWQSFIDHFAGRSLRAPSGMLALRDADDYLCGLIAYRVEHNLRHGRVLCVHLFTAIDLANSKTLLQALLDAAETRAVELGSSAVEIRLRKEQAGLAARMRKLGLSHAAGLYVKEVDRRSRAN